MNLNSELKNTRRLLENHLKELDEQLESTKRTLQDLDPVQEPKQ